MKRFVFLFFLLVGSNINLFALQTSSNMLILAAIQSKCILNVQDLNFGDYEVTQALAHDQTTTIDVKCTNGTSYSVSFDKGLNNVGSFTDRKAVHGANATSVLNYNLYRDVGRTELLGDGISDGTTTIQASGSGLNTANQHTIYGRIPPLQDVESGNYTDTIVVTVTY